MLICWRTNCAIRLFSLNFSPPRLQIDYKEERRLPECATSEAPALPCERSAEQLREDNIQKEPNLGGICPQSSRLRSDDNSVCVCVCVSVKSCMNICWNIRFGLRKPNFLSKTEENRLPVCVRPLAVIQLGDRGVKARWGAETGDVFIDQHLADPQTNVGRAPFLLWRSLFRRHLRWWCGRRGSSHSTSRSSMWDSD